MMTLFGTDGIRGRANKWPITPEVIVQIGRAVAIAFSKDSAKSVQPPARYKRFNPYIDNEWHQFTVVIGKDTRLSGYMIESALVAGLVSQGANVIMLGPIPTSAISMLARSLRANVGIMISASHNPYYDNGIKFFDADGVKFSIETEKYIECIVKRLLEHNSHDDIYAENCGKSIRLDDASGRYVEFAKATFPKNLNLNNLKIVIDCANGAAYKVAPRILWELGASVITLSDEPNGRNINEQCGALHTANLQKCVNETNADVGIALDGDADRVVIVTPKGQIINGDQILALIARELVRDNMVHSGGVVSTCMSNLGLREYLQNIGVKHFESQVGDKNVVSMMKQTQSIIGGEESGHIIIGNYTTTGDGIIAILQMLGIAKKQDLSLDQIFPVFHPYAQITKNFEMNEHITDKFIQELQTELDNLVAHNGRAVIRRSGTEHVLRIMIQHQNMEKIDKIFKAITSDRQWLKIR
ncbi:MAG: phosphoglucosamine mutase [Holosporales bacterium]|jgi:phosphoglucosamine mutase|nr:phosphoglucosamine mutase [Holosporales bacterium]